MPRSIQVAGPASLIDAVCERLPGMEGVTGYSRLRAASLQPPGDRLSIDATNDATRRVFALLDELRVHEHGSIGTSELQSLVSPGHQDEIESETNETVWDEMASLLRQDTNIDFNFLSLMFLAGAIAAGGLWSDKLHLIVGAMLIAPAFEPLLRMPFGLVAGMPRLARGGAIAGLVGYLMLLAGAALTALVLNLVEPGTSASLATHQWVGYWSSFSSPGVLLSVFGACAGAIVVSGLRSVLTTGVMVTLALIPSLSLAGMALVLGEFALAAHGFFRWIVDAVLVIVFGGAVLALKQKFVHRRRATG